MWWNTWFSVVGHLSADKLDEVYHETGVEFNASDNTSKVAAFNTDVQDKK